MGGDVTIDNIESQDVWQGRADVRSVLRCAALRTLHEVLSSGITTSHRLHVHGRSHNPHGCYHDSGYVLISSWLLTRR